MKVVIICCLIRNTDKFSNSYFIKHQSFHNMWRLLSSYLKYRPTIYIKHWSLLDWFMCCVSYLCIFLFFSEDCIMAWHKTPTTLFVDNPVFGYSQKHVITAFVDAPVQHLFLSSFEDRRKSTGITFEIWQRSYFPNIRDCILYKVSSLSLVNAIEYFLWSLLESILLN